MGMNHIDVIRLPTGCAQENGRQPEGVLAAGRDHRQRMVSNNPVIMKANAMA